MAEAIQLPPGMENMKLTDWPEEPTLKQLKQDYEDARSSHDAQVSVITEWLDYLLIRDGAKLKPSPNRSSVQPKLIRKQAEWRYANLSEPFLSSPDVFNVKPVTWEDRDAARQNSLVLNHQLNNRLDKQLFIDNLVRAAVDEGTAIVKTGWEYRTKTEMVPHPIYTVTPNAKAEQQIMEIDELFKQSPSQYNEVPEEWRTAHQMSVETGIIHAPIVTGTTLVEEEVTTRNQPTLEVCDYRNVIIDPTCAGDLTKAQFVIHKFESSMSDLEADGRYSNLEYINAENQSVLGEPDYAPASNGTKNFNFTDKARRKFTVFEYWGFRDIDGSGIVKPFVATWVGNVKIRMEENPFPDGELPFVTIPYLPVRNSIYGESDGSLLIDNQKIVGATTRGMIDLFAKSANGQTGIAKGTLDVVNRRRFERGEDYEWNPGADPRATIHQHVFPDIPASAQYMIDMNNNEAESITGVKAFSSGIAGQALGDTATGIRGALDAASKRELGLLRRISSGMIKIGRKIIAMNQAWLDETETVRVTNDHFVTVRRDDLNGAFDLELTISTAEEDNAKSQELAFMFQTLGDQVDWGVRSMILGDIARLRKMPDLAQRILTYQPQPDPMQQQIQQLQILKLQAEIATEQARAASFGAGANLSTVKQNTEVAKANHLQAAADKTNLDFVEQETGTQHERAMQGLRTQAESQIGLKVAESVLRQQEPNQLNKPSR